MIFSSLQWKRQIQGRQKQSFTMQDLRDHSLCSDVKDHRVGENKRNAFHFSRLTQKTIVLRAQFSTGSEEEAGCPVKQAERPLNFEGQDQ